jgi:hypothetical protein
LFFGPVYLYGWPVIYRIFLGELMQQFTLWDFVEGCIYGIALYVAANFIYIFIK